MVARLTRSVVTLSSPMSFAQGQALEDKLLTEVSGSRNHVAAGVWRMERCLVMPMKFGGIMNFNALSVESRSRGWPIYLRRTGGDLTPQHPGFFNFSYAFRANAMSKRTVAGAYQFLCDPLLNWIATLVRKEPQLGATSDSFCDGDFNINLDGRKVAGTAQRWRSAREYGAGEEFIVLGHAVVLASGPIDPCVEIVNWFRARTATGMAVKTESHTTLLQEGLHEDEQHLNCVDLMQSFGNYLQNSDTYGDIQFS